MVWENLPSTNTPLNATNLNQFQEYSTTETVIGKWTDGKPLYRKAYPITINHTGSGSTQAYTNNHNLSNVETIYINRGASYGLVGADRLGADSLYVDNGTLGFYMRNEVNTTRIRTDVYYSANTSINLIIILEYTKTTD